MSVTEIHERLVKIERLLSQGSLGDDNAVNALAGELGGLVAGFENLEGRLRRIEEHLSAEAPHLVGPTPDFSGGSDPAFGGEPIDTPQRRGSDGRFE